MRFGWKGAAVAAGTTPSPGWTWTCRLVRWGLGGLFLYAGVRKLFQLERFADVIGDYGILPEFLVHPAAVGLPILEAVAGLALLLNLTGALAIVTGLLVLFTAVLTYGLWLGLDIECWCGFEAPGVVARTGLRIAIVRDILLLVACAFLYGCRWKGIAKKPKGL